MAVYSSTAQAIRDPNLGASLSQSPLCTTKPALSRCFLAARFRLKRVLSVVVDVLLQYPSFLRLLCRLKQRVLSYQDDLQAGRFIYSPKQLAVNRAKKKANETAGLRRSPKQNLESSNTHCEPPHPSLRYNAINTEHDMIQSIAKARGVIALPSPDT